MIDSRDRTLESLRVRKESTLPEFLELEDRLSKLTSPGSGKLNVLFKLNSMITELRREYALLKEFNSNFEVAFT